MSEHGDFESPKKSAYSVERYDSSWELDYMKRLERDRTIVKWTKNHGIAIRYITEAGNPHLYRPDFLVERIDGTKELHEVKGAMLNSPDTQRKHESAKSWCGKRGMVFLVITKALRW